MPKIHWEEPSHDTCTADICRLFHQRLRTFAEWRYVSLPHELASAGFVYLGKSNEVSCLECPLRINLPVDSRPLILHQNQSPNCPFVLTHGEQKVSNQPTRQSSRQDYSDINRRLQSFIGWPLRDVAHRPEVMSRCGYFYSGCADKVVCFSCGLELRDWKDGHCPIQRHEEGLACSFVSQTEAVSIRQEIEELRELMETDDYNYTEVFHTKPTTPLCIIEGKTCVSHPCKSCDQNSGNPDTEEETLNEAKHRHYSILKNRLDSFTSWPLNRVSHSPEIMSESGFFYTGSSDKVICYCCGITLRAWQYGVSPPVRHQELSPDCSHVAKLDVSVIENKIRDLERLQVEFDDYNYTEIFEDTSKHTIALLIEGLVCEDECLKECQSFDEGEPELQQGDLTQMQNVQIEKQIGSTQQDQSCDKWSEFSTEQNRLASFKSWPLTDVALSPEMMSRSGFFYTGSADRVTCFSCGVTLRDWQDDDNPALVHRRCSEECHFVEQFDLEAIVRELKELENLLYFDDYNVTEIFDRKTIRRSDSGIQFCPSKFFVTESSSTC